MTTMHQEKEQALPTAPPTTAPAAPTPIPTTPVTQVTKKQTVKPKNAKRVEQGKRLAEHNKKMKEQLAKMKTEETESEIIQNTPDSRLLYVGGLILVGGIGFLLYKSSNKSPENSKPIQITKPSLPQSQPEELLMD